MSDLLTALSGAVERGEISAWFQPQLDLATGTIVAAEALCRWTHSEFGSVPPSLFIPLAEQYGIIHEIGLFMLQQGAAAAAEWARNHRPIEVSVNVSAAQLATPTLTEQLAIELERLALPPQAITIEITESLPVPDITTVAPRLAELRDLGLGVAIDDFGTGHSSLTQLRKLPATELKIDRSLIVDNSPNTTTLLRNVIDDVHEAGLRVVAEGVETAAQLERARELSCDRAQGYFISRPVPKQQFELMLAV